MVCSATFSPCRKYRYSLTRTWDDGLGKVCFLGCNPSTADETINDPTVTRCINFAKDWGFGTMEMLNIFALRSTDPKELYKSAEPVSPPYKLQDGLFTFTDYNDLAILKSCSDSDLIVCCWGNHGKYLHRGELVTAMLKYRTIMCLGITKQGYPKHPLYLRADTKPIVYKMES